MNESWLCTIPTVRRWRCTLLASWNAEASLCSAAASAPLGTCWSTAATAWTGDCFCCSPVPRSVCSSECSAEIDLYHVKPVRITTLTRISHETNFSYNEERQIPDQLSEGGNMNFSCGYRRQSLIFFLIINKRNLPASNTCVRTTWVILHK